uniref:Shikimate kinase n=1 Tax=Lactuca sativa TaxID=4236 RepID=A0A9R1UM78_LACSA|nr:hypothetical protein LSAT_V11C800405660 [Lactuca sativa]
MLNRTHLWPINAAFGHGSPETKALCSTQQSSASAFQFECFSVEEDLMIKNKLEKIGPYLDGRCIYLVGMMGSGKTTVGQILSEILGYSFVDSDKLIEEVVGGIAVADIFKLHGEKFFREKEEAVIDAWIGDFHGWRKYMQKGVTIFLDVPLETLALRIVSVGTASRPLLHDESGEAYVKVVFFSLLNILIYKTLM